MPNEIRGNRNDNNLIGTLGDDLISGFRGDDTLDGGAGRDILRGGSGADLLFGGAGNDRLFGGGGDDVLTGGAGNDVLNGGRGTDTAVFSGNRDDYTITLLSNGKLRVEGPDARDTLVNIELLQFADMTQTAEEALAPRIFDLTLDGAFWTVATDRDLNDGASVDMQLSLTNPGTVTATDARIVTVLSRDGTVSDNDVEIGSTLVTLEAGQSTQFRAAYDVDADVPSGVYTVLSYILWDTPTGPIDTSATPAQGQMQLRFVGGTFYGTDGDDTFFAANVAETFVLGAGDDTVTNVREGDVVLAGDGTDTVGINSSRVDLDVVQIDATTVELSRNGDTIRVSDAEVFRFFDATLTFDELLAPPAANVAASDLVIEDGSFTVDGTPRVSWTVTQEGLLRTGVVANDVLIATSPDLADVVSTQSGQTSYVSRYGESQTRQVDLDLTSLAPGTYYIAVKTDSADVLVESDEADNLTEWVAFTVAEKAYDLSLDSVVIAPTAGPVGTGLATVDITVTVSNLGNVDIDKRVSVQLFVSEDDIGTYTAPDDWLGAALIDTLPAGETVTLTVTRTLSPTLLDGDYNLVARLQNNFTPDDDLSNNKIVLEDELSITRLVVDGTDGNDVLSSTSASETIRAGLGDDLISAGAGNDVVDGGAGTDTVDFSGWTSLVYGRDFTGNNSAVQSGTGVDGSGTLMRFQGVERIIGTDNSDFIDLKLTETREVASGGEDDYVFGSFEDDTLNGGDGNDLISGSFGDDILTGGAGSDRFVFERENDSLNGATGSGHDRITDFDPEMDRIEIQLLQYKDQLDPLDALVETDEGTIVAYADGSGVLVEGITLDQLTADNLLTVDF